MRCKTKLCRIHKTLMKDLQMLSLSHAISVSSWWGGDAASQQSLSPHMIERVAVIRAAHSCSGLHSFVY